MLRFKSNGKKMLSLLLAAGMALSLAGCGKGGTPAQSGANGSADNKQQAGGQQQVQAEGNYYEGEYEKLPEDSSSIGMVTVTEQAVYYVKFVEEEENATKFMKYDTESKQVTEMSFTLPDGYSIDQLCADSEGNLVAVSANWENSGANGGIPYTVTVFKDDGSVIMEKDITELLAEKDAPYVYHLAAGDEGRIYVAGGQDVWVLDNEGNLEFSVPTEGWISEMGILPGGKLAVAFYEGGGIVVKVLDYDKKAWGDTYKNDRFGNDLHFTQAGETGIYFYDADALYSFEPESNETKVLANWINNDILAEYLVYVSVQDESTIRLITCDYNASTGGNEIALLKQTDAQAVSDKQIITFGTVDMTTGIRSSIINFNKKSDKYRLQIIEYSSGTTPEEGATRFKNEITAGNMPDIINISDGTEEFYAAKGLLEDLKPYFDTEQGINRADYFENILTAMETGGKMYVLSPDFYIDTLAGKTKYVGEGYSWTMEDMKRLEETREEGVEMFDHETKAGVLDISLRYNLAQFFDMSKGFCDFDNPEFRDILEFANRFPKENEYQEGDASDWRKANDGNLLLTRDGIMMIQD
nr:extracellular solute-binding protein [Lachnospiraceae bacterium]